MPYITSGWTADMLDVFPDDGKRYEIIGGELIVNPSPTWGHQGLAFQLSTLLGAYLNASGAGWLVPDVDIKFRPADVVRPDIIVAPLVEGRAPRSFDETRRLLLVVEILSPSSVNRDRRAKKALYTRMRVPEYWIVDRSAQVVERWRPGATSAEILRDTIEWRPETASDPFVLDLRALFRRVAGE